MESSWWDRLRRHVRPTVDSAIDDLMAEDEYRRERAAIWVWSRGREHFSGDERARLIEALAPLATDDTPPIAARTRSAHLSRWKQMGQLSWR